MHLYLRFFVSVLLLLLLTACQTESSTPNSTSPESQKPVYIPPKPLTEEKDIVLDPGEGIYAANRYHMEKVWKELDKVASGLSKEQYFAEVLRLVGERYDLDEKDYIALQQKKYEIDLLSLDPNSPEVQGKIQEASKTPKRNAVILVDASGSMNGMVDGKRKMDLAKEAVNQFVSQLSPDTNITLRVYGHKGSNHEKDKAVSCQSSEVVYGPASYNGQKFQSSLNSLKPVGWTPLALAIRDAKKELPPTQPGVENIVYVVSDGLETCGGDPIQEARNLYMSDVKAVVNIIGFDLDEESKKQLEKVANAGGGTFQSVDNGEDLKKTLDAYAKVLHEQNTQWYEKELNKLQQTYNSDSTFLENLHQQSDDKLKREHIRLLNAISYLYVQKKIDIDMWRSVANLADSRRYSLGRHFDSAWYDSGQNIVNNWNDLVSKIDDQYYQNTQKVDEATNKTVIRFKGVRVPELNTRIGATWIPPVRILSTPPETLEEIKSNYSS